MLAIVFKDADNLEIFKEIVMAGEVGSIDTPSKDWTIDPETGRSNSSEAFVEIRDFVAELLRSEVRVIQAGGAEAAAQHIVAQLAHTKNMMPVALEYLPVS